MADTNIEWTDKTWNPVRGCKPVSSGCANCYAMGVAARFSGPDQPYEGLAEFRDRKARWTGEFRFVPEMLAKPLSWRKSQRIFVNSMSDLFGEGVSNEQIAAVFGVMAACPQHTFQVLTKRAERMRKWFEWMISFADEQRDIACAPNRALTCISAALTYGVPKHLLDRAYETEVDSIRETWPLRNVHLGVSAENQQTANERIPLLLQCPAALRWVSAEPLLGPINFRDVSSHGLGRDALIVDDPGNNAWPAERHLDWLVVGGESGPRARPCNLDWIRSIVRQCRAAKVPVFVKQLGAKPATLQDRKGGDPNEWPEDLRVREWPHV